MASGTFKNFSYENNDGGGVGWFLQFFIPYFIFLCSTFESRRCMDIFHIDLVYCLFEKTENKLKRCRGRPKFKKNCFAVFCLSPVFVRSTSLLFCYLLSHSWNGNLFETFLLSIFQSENLDLLNQDFHAT